MYNITIFMKYNSSNILSFINTFKRITFGQSYSFEFNFMEISKMLKTQLKSI